MLRPLIAAVAALVLGAPALFVPAYAQTTLSPSTQQVQLLAPQLVPFSGSTGNFESLVVGLTTAAPVTLATVGADGTLQIVTFTPGTTLSTTDTARVLEAARQRLISRGIAAPTAQQIAASLMGGTVVSPSGTSAVIGVITGTASSPTPVTVRTDSVVPQGSAPGSNLSAAQLQAVRNALATGTAVTLTTTGTNGAPQNVTFTPTGGRLSDFEVNQALQLAGTLLAQQGVLNPTADQLRAALFGGRLQLTNGSNVLLQGVLQGQLRATSASSGAITSASPAINTSASPTVSTSDSPVVSTGATPPANSGTSPLAVSATPRPPIFGSGSASSAGATAVGAGLAPRGSPPARTFGAR
jgi:hypothetical protein